MFKDISKAYIYENLVLGFKFELFSPIKRKQLAENLSQALGKNVQVLDTSDNSFPLDETIFKIEPAFSGGHKMHELTTGPLPYFEAIHILYKVCNFIQENAYTTNRCGVTVNVSIDENALNLKAPLLELNIFKFVVGLNEAKLLDLWPTDAQSKVQKVYKNPVSFIYPKNRFIAETFNVNTMTNSVDYNLPKSKFYGIDFTKLDRGYIGVRYAGGVQYEKKKHQLTEMIDLIGEHLVTVLSNNKTYTPVEIQRITTILEKQKTIVSKLRTYENFVRNFPEVRFTVDMKDAFEGCKARYIQMRDKITDLFEYCNLTKAELNYDSERKRLQIRGATVHSSFVLEDYDFFECKIQAELKNCLVYECKVVSSLLEQVYLSHNNEVKYSYLEHCHYSDGADNIIKQSYLKNSSTAKVAGQLTECIVNKGIISEISIVDSKTELIGVEKDYLKIV